MNVVTSAKIAGIGLGTVWKKLNINHRQTSSLFRYFTYSRSICFNKVSENVTPEESAEHYDIVIAGGGMVGFAVACALGLSPKLEDRKILLLEQQQETKWDLPEEYSNRVCSLSSHTKQLFQKIGAWDHIEAMRAQPVRKMQVWESCSESFITFDEHDIHETVAHIVENDVILHSLRKQLPKTVKVVYDSKISKYVLPDSIDNMATVIFEDGNSVSTELLIGADGANSEVRRNMGSHYVSWEYDHMGIVATLQLSEEEDNFTAWQKFLPTGPVAMLPLSSNRSSLVWSATLKQAKELCALSDIDFVDALNNAVWNDEPHSPIVKDIHGGFQNLLQTFCPGTSSHRGVKQLPPSFSSIVPGSRASFPLGLGHASHYAASRVALVGDAVHRVHPLAGQGVNLGFGDVAALVSTLEAAVNLGCDIGDERQLYHYETCRQRHNVVSMATIDGLYRLYSTTFLPVVLLRSLGLSAVDALEPVKKRIMMYAEG